MSIEAMLQKVPFLSEMADEEISRLVDRGRVLSVAAEQTVFREGDQADCMYVILGGQVRIFLQDEEGHEIRRKDARELSRESMRRMEVTHRRNGIHAAKPRFRINPAKPTER